MNYNDLITKAVQTHFLSKDELVCLLSDTSCSDALFNAADTVRRQYVGDQIHLRGLIEFSNICRNNCCYCGLRRDNHKLTRYRLTEDEIFALAEHAATDLGLKTIVLQSGEDLYFDQERMCHIIKKIKTLDVALTLSIGEKTLSEYQAYKNAGANRFLLRIETTNKDLYHRLDPGMSWQARKQCLDDLRLAGLEVGTGIMVGLPGQDIASMADDILFFKDIKADMIGIGPFIPHPDTPLAGNSGGTLDLSLKVMALTRLLLPDINIPATTAMEALAPSGQLKALQSGANVIMPNVTLNDYRKFYDLYPGKSSTNVSPDNSLAALRDKIASIGRSIATDYGFHQKKFKI